jgi:hypothetical protein
MLVSLACLVCIAHPLAAQVCVGDCTGVGMVGISDLILAVNIALGLASADQCVALGVPPIGISQLIASVNNALCGCEACPTPPPVPPTSTPSPTYSPTPTASPTPGPIISTWHEDTFKIPSSSCPSQVTTQLRQALATAMTDYTVTQRDQDVVIDDGEGDVFTGTIDRDGTVHATTQESQSKGICVLTLDFQLTVNLSNTPTTAAYTVGLSTTNCTPRLACSVKLTTHWTRTSAALQDHGGALAVMRDALHASP